MSGIHWTSFLGFLFIFIGDVMNERIEKIIDQAYLELHKEDADRFFGQRTIAKKVAELIVMECLTICEELGDKGMDGHYCADKINKTFRS